MAKYNSRIRSIIEGLSDFWLVFFKDVDQLQAFYQGSEILIGQAYLDMLSLLLNNSTRDALLFNRELFKLVQIQESEIAFREGATLEDDRYVYALEDDVADLLYLNNKIFAVTASLDKTVDFAVEDGTRDLAFNFDPTNAYLERTFGDGNSAFKVRTVIANTPMRVYLDDDGTLAPVLSRINDGLDIRIQYDGPANGSTTTANTLIGAINVHPEISGLIAATLSTISKGTASPAGTVGLVDLLPLESSPLTNYAVRNVTSGFSSAFTVRGVADWIALGVKKGDTLRLLSGTNIGSSVEHLISLVRKDTLYTDVGVTLDRDPGTQLAYAILRTPADAQSSNEPIANSGIIQDSGADGVVVAASRQFSSPTVVFSDVHVGDIVELAGSLNIRASRIVSVINSTTVELADTGLQDETPLAWNFRSVVSATNLGTDGALVNNGDGTGQLTSASATFSNVNIAGTILRIARGGEIEQYEVVESTGPLVITVRLDASVAAGTGLTWGLADIRPPATKVVFSTPTAWPTGTSVTVSGRRLLDDTAVQAGRDYAVDENKGTVTPITVWKTSLTNTVNYTYRFVVTTSDAPTQSGVDGTLTLGSPDTFSSPIALFDSSHVGQALVITNSSVASGGTNNGTYIIDSIVSPTTARLTAARALNPTADLNNGFLVWGLEYWGAQAVEDITTIEKEIAFWAPDALIDKYHLYNTYGYLIGRFEQSSEAYRSLIRGVFQLFMLGPTLERFESAINTVAGLDVIRDNGELLLGYNSGAEQSGTDGIFAFATKTFSSASATFTAADAGRFIFAVEGNNANFNYQIQRVIDTNTVALTSSPTTDTGVLGAGVAWELTSTLEQTVRTSLRTYTFDRSIPIRERVKDSANFGLIIFEEFEVLTDAFKVTDYIESPTWWKETQIPEELLTNEDAARRQSSPKLFENVINPADDGRVGDPGFRIGANSDGFSPPSALLRDDAGALDGVLTPDPLFPFSTTVYFDSPTAAFTSADLGNVVTVDPTATPRTYLILEIVSATRVRIQSFGTVEAPLSALDWEIRSQPLPVRHKMAFIVLDKFLKQHLFSVEFDASLLGQVSSTLITDLQELVFVAKPSYTYIVLSPSTFFQEVINVGEEQIITAPNLGLGGAGGEQITVGTPPLTISGGSWRIGNWFRYIESSGSFGTPAASVPATLGAPDAGYAHHLSKFTIDDPETFVDLDGNPINWFGDVTKTYASGTGLSIEASTATITLPVAILDLCLVMSRVVITGSGLGNDGTFRIGRVLNAEMAVIEDAGFADETGLNYSIITNGSCVGEVRTDAQGQVFFDAKDGIHQFDPADAGTVVRRPFVTYPSNQTFPIYEVLSAGAETARIATVKQVAPITGDPDYAALVLNNGGSPSVELTTSLIPLLITDEMLRLEREQNDFATSLKLQYYIRITSGANNGERRRLQRIEGTELILDGPAWSIDLPTFVIEVETAPDIVPEITDWEHLTPQMVINGDVMDLSGTPTQDVDTVDYQSYGVREPIDPGSETFDATAGDTYYAVGMVDPRPTQGRTRTGHDTDLREDPIQITRTP